MNETGQWGGIALPADPKDRPEFVKQLLAQYTELQIEQTRRSSISGTATLSSPGRGNASS